MCTVCLVWTRPRSKRAVHLVNSIGQDICRVVTQGKWNLPKHVILGMTLRHLFRSAELVTILNRLGHSENYSFLLELETALVTATEMTSDLLPMEIIRNPSCPFLFHSDFDNSDEFVNDLAGAGSVHRSLVIMLQEIITVAGQEVGGVQPQLPVSLPRTGQRTMTSTAETTLEDCYVGRRKSPSYEIVRTYAEGGKEAHKQLLLKNLLWILICLHSLKTN